MEDRTLAEENFFEIAYTLENVDETRAMYDRWAQVYDRDLNNGEYKQPIRCAEALKAVLPESGIKILDVGCGTGLSGMALAESGYQNIDGCDLSQGMLDQADKLDIYRRLFTCDLNSPPLDAEADAYDAVTAVGVFSFGHIMPDAVEELRRITISGGIIIIGLNDHYYDEGSLVTKLEAMEQAGKIEIIAREHGEHIPQNDLKGWVLTLKAV